MADNIHRAKFYNVMANEMVNCFLCRHRCVIAPGKRGICNVRENRGGELYSLVYGNLVAENIDPIEKKPLFHFLTKTLTYSIAAIGCNFHCEFCQNHEIAQFEPQKSSFVPGIFVSPEELVVKAIKSGCPSISYTYTEPTVWGEYVLDVARIACAAGLKNIMVTNGYITPEALDELSPYIHSANIDIKGFSEQFYKTVVGAKLNEVLDCIKDFYRRGIWIELTTLLIPGENDTEEQLKGIARFITDELSMDVPWHISRFFPRNRMMDTFPTPISSLLSGKQIAEKTGLKYVYLGNCTP